MENRNAGSWQASGEFFRKQVGFEHNSNWSPESAVLKTCPLASVYIKVLSSHLKLGFWEMLGVSDDSALAVKVSRNFTVACEILPVLSSRHKVRDYRYTIRALVHQTPKYVKNCKCGCGEFCTAWSVCHAIGRSRFFCWNHHRYLRLRRQHEKSASRRADFRLTANSRGRASWRW